MDGNSFRKVRRYDDILLEPVINRESKEGEFGFRDAIIEANAMESVEQLERLRYSLFSNKMRQRMTTSFHQMALDIWM